MPAYAYPINIDYGYKKTRIIEEHDLDGFLTLDVLRKYVSDQDEFIISDKYHDGPSRMDPDTKLLTIFKWKVETESERSTRIEKEERYMEEYNKRKNK